MGCAQLRVPVPVLISERSFTGIHDDISRAGLDARRWES